MLNKRRKVKAFTIAEIGRGVLGVGLSVNGARRGEDDTFHAILRHEFQKVHQRVQIVAIIEQRLFNTFANGFRCGKVDDALNA